jgi:MYXO-CTERM domain-containing protein
MAGLAGALLALLHIGLLIERLRHEAPTDPTVLLRWAGALALLGGAALWRRRTGRSLWSGREALVFWTLVALLHAGAPLEPMEATASTTAVLAFLCLVSLALPGGLLPSRLASARRLPQPPRRSATGIGRSGGPRSAPRPPPVFRVA